MLGHEEGSEFIYLVLSGQRAREVRATEGENHAVLSGPHLRLQQSRDESKQREESVGPGKAPALKWMQGTAAQVSRREVPSSQGKWQDLTSIKRETTRDAKAARKHNPSVGKKSVNRWYPDWEGGENTCLCLHIWP